MDGNDQEDKEASDSDCEVDGVDEEDEEGEEGEDRHCYFWVENVQFLAIVSNLKIALGSFSSRILIAEGLVLS